MRAGASAPPSSLSVSSQYRATPAGGRIDAIDCSGGPPCSALLESGDHRYFLMQENGLSRWSASAIGSESQPLPSDPSMSCPVQGTCEVAYGNTVSSTNDGGTHWSTTRVPGHQTRVASVSCESILHCIAVGTELATKSRMRGVIWTKNGYRANWIRHALTDNDRVRPVKLSCLPDVGCALAVSYASAVFMLYAPTSSATFSLAEQVPGLTSVRAMSCQPVGNEPGCTLIGSSGTLAGSQLETVQADGSAHIYPLRASSGAGTIGCLGQGLCLVPTGSGISLVNTLADSSSKVSTTARSPTIDAIGCFGGTCVYGGTDSDNGLRFEQSDNGAAFVDGPEDGGPAYGLLTGCPSNVSCPVLLNGGQHDGILISPSSHSSWSTTSMPNGFDPSAGSCATDQWCGVVGTIDAATQSEFAIVSGTGATGAVLPLPVNAAQLSAESQAMSCPSMLHCVLLVGSQAGPATVATTIDGGKSWVVSSHQIGGTLFDVTIECATNLNCAAGGTTYGKTNANGDFLTPDQAHLYYSSDGGLTWNEGRTPRHIGHVDGLACNHDTCWAAARDNQARQDGTAVAFVRSPDGGRIWDRAPSPPEVGAVSVEGFNCKSGNECWALMTLNRSVVEVSTSDGGTHWQQRRVNVPAGQVWQAICPTVDACMATNNGSAGVLVFTLQAQ
jgi:hypothetical protein